MGKTRRLCALDRPAFPTHPAHPSLNHSTVTLFARFLG